MKPEQPQKFSMTLRAHANLIPRNNWDYGVAALWRAFRSAAKTAGQAPNFEKIYQQAPLWTNSGRTSLYAILKALELPAGAGVGVPLFCCSVVFNAICQAGLRPVFLDSNLDDFNLSIDDLRQKRPGLAAVVAVHMFGKACDMDAINSIAGPIPVIEDCAQSILATYQGKQTGLLSTASFFSFRCGKYISAGEGSAIICRDAALRQKIERQVNEFESWSTPEKLLDALMTFIKATLYHRPWYGLLGYPVGMRLDKKLNLTAKDGFKTGKIASTHLDLMDSRIAGFQQKINRQRDHAHRLQQALAPGPFGVPAEDDSGSRNWYQFALTFPNTAQRDEMAAYLLSQGIDTAKYLDDIAAEARAGYGYGGDCPNAETLARSVLLVPIHYNLQPGDIDHIARSINAGSQIS